MKICPLCHESYTDWIDFCFKDGEPLVQEGVPLASPGAAAVAGATPLIGTLARKGPTSSSPLVSSLSEPFGPPKKVSKPAPVPAAPAPVSSAPASPPQTAAPAPVPASVPAPRSEPPADVDEEDSKGPPILLFAGIGAVLLLLLLVGGILAFMSASTEEDPGGLAGEGPRSGSEVPDAGTPDGSPPEDPEGPDQPTETPERPTETPERPTETPERPTETPERPTETPNSVGAGTNNGGASQGGTSQGTQSPPELDVAMVTFVFRPEDATLSIDGQGFGQAHRRELRLSHGSHVVNVSKDGYVSKTDTVDVAGSAREFSYTLEPEIKRLVRVMVRSTKYAGDLVVDGKDAGTMPATLELEEGMHTFTASGEDGRFQTRRRVTYKEGLVQIDLDSE